MIRLYLCFDCGKLFWNPKDYTETHGLDYGPYEHFKGCPKCGGAYCKAYKCDECGKWITSDYIKVRGFRYCDSCFKEVELGEEDEKMVW